MIRKIPNLLSNWFPPICSDFKYFRLKVDSIMSINSIFVTEESSFRYEIKLFYGVIFFRQSETKIDFPDSYSLKRVFPRVARANPTTQFQSASIQKQYLGIHFFSSKQPFVLFLEQHWTKIKCLDWLEVSKYGNSLVTCLGSVSCVTHPKRTRI